MLEAIRELGMYSLKRSGINLDNVASLFIQSPFAKNIKDITSKGDIYPFKVIKINFITIPKVQFKDIVVEDYREEYVERYLYRRKASQGPDFTPVSKFAGDVEKTIKKKILAWFRANKDIEFFPVEEVYREFEGNLPLIMQKIEEKIEEYPKSGMYFLILITIDDKYPGDIRGFREYLAERVKEKYREVYHEKGVCSLCGKRGEVFGNTSPYKFYTLDKPGYIAGGFKKEEGWKNFPLCFECALLLEEGKAYLENDIGRFLFAGLNYYLIPRSSIGDIDSLEEVLSIYESFKERKLSITKGMSIARAEEDDILPFMKDLKDFYTLNFLFYTKSNDKITIDLLMEDIYPSRLKRLFEAKKRAENYGIFKNAVSIGKGDKRELSDFYFSFSIVREFVESDKSKSKSYKEFLNVIDKIFKGNKIDYEYVISRIMSKIRKRFINDFSIGSMTLEALVFLYFLQELDLLDKEEKGGEQMETLVKNELTERIETFFKEHEKSFTTPSKKAIFLTGVLTQFLLNIQKTDRGAEPFRKQLKSLKMGEEDVRALLPKIIGKLEDYKKNYYRKLEELISFYMLQAGDKWGMSKDEINYYFVLGLALAGATGRDGKSIFKIETEGGKEDE